MGLKPSYGLVSTRGIIPLSQSLDHAGPITRTVEDAASPRQSRRAELGGDDPRLRGTCTVQARIGHRSGDLVLTQSRRRAPGMGKPAVLLAARVVQPSSSLIEDVSRWRPIDRFLGRRPEFPRRSPSCLRQPRSLCLPARSSVAWRIASHVVRSLAPIALP